MQSSSTKPPLTLSQHIYLLPLYWREAFDPRAVLTARGLGCSPDSHGMGFLHGNMGFPWTPVDPKQMQTVECLTRVTWEGNQHPTTLFPAHHKRQIFAIKGQAKISWCQVGNSAVENCSACGLTQECGEKNRWWLGMINRSVSAQSNLPQDVAEAEE